MALLRPLRHGDPVGLRHMALMHLETGDDSPEGSGRSQHADGEQSGIYGLVDTQNIELHDFSPSLLLGNCPYARTISSAVPMAEKLEFRPASIKLLTVTSKKSQI
jgi:hypothetical protein